MSYFILFVYFSITTLCFTEGNEISDKRMCFDPKCSEPVSLAKALVRYYTGYEEGLSFSQGDVFKIYSKSSGTRPDLWGAEVRGKRGYIPKDMVQEIKVYHPDETLKFDVSTASHDDSFGDDPVEKGEKEVNSGALKVERGDGNVNDPPATINSESSKIGSYDVIDGTTIFADPLVAETPTINPIEIKTSEVSIEATASFSATSDSLKSQTLSELSPITATTMTEKPEIGIGNNENPPGTKSAIELGEPDVSGFVSVKGDAKNPSLGVADAGGEVDLHEKPNSPESGHDTGDREQFGLETASEDEEMIDDEEEGDEDEEEGGEDEEDGGEDEEEELLENEDPEIQTPDEDGIMESVALVNNATDTSQTDARIESSGSFENYSVSSSEYFSASRDELIENSNSMSKEIPLEEDLSRESPQPETPAPKILNSPSTPDQVVYGSDLDEKSSDVLKTTTRPPDGEVKPGELGESGATDLEEVIVDQVGIPGDKSAPQKLEFPQSIDGHRAKEDVSVVESSDGSSVFDGYTGAPNESSSNEGIETGNAKLLGSTGSDNSNEYLTMTEEVRGEDMEYAAAEVTIESFKESASETSHLEMSTISTVGSEVTSESYAVTDALNHAGAEYNNSRDEPRAENVEGTDAGGSAEDELPPPVPPYPIADGEQESDTAIKEPNPSEIEDPVNPSSVLHDFLSSVYNAVGNVIFGSGVEEVVVVEGTLERSLPEAPEVPIAGKDSDSVPTHYQYGLVDEIHNSASGGESVFGSSKNSQCKGSISNSVCDVAPELQDGHSEIGPEDGSWIGFFSIGYDSFGLFDLNVPSLGAMIYSVITGLIVLFFFLGHYFIEGNRRDVELLAKINSLEKELTVASKECLILKEKLKHFEVKSSSFEDSAEIINSIKEELERVQNEKSQLEKELEATTEAGLEMEHMVSQFLSTQHDSKSLTESIEQLQMQANKQQAKISSLENSLIAKTQESEKLAEELNRTEEKIQELEEDLKQVSEKTQCREEEFIKQYEELKELSACQQIKFLEDLKTKSIETEMALTRCKSLETTITEMKEMLAVKDNEMSVLEECLRKLSKEDDPNKASEQLENILNFGKLKAELAAVTMERDRLKDDLQGEGDARKLLEDHVKVIREEVEKLRKCHETAEREKVEAQTRLEVLSSYFKEKETQLQKELGNKEALWVQKNMDTSAVLQHMKSLEEEVENYSLEEVNRDDFIENSSENMEFIVETSDRRRGSQNETLKKEILDQERGYKTQLASFEKKAHENWVAARQAERKLDESKQEASQLRNRLTTMVDKTHPSSTSQNGDDSKPNLSMIDSNGSASSPLHHLGLASNSSVDLTQEPHPLYLDPNASPPHVGGRIPLPHFPPPPHSPYPLSPPLPFVPPPPPSAMYPASSAADGHRPPPLGRMSSPPPPSQSPHLATESRGGEFPYCDRGGRISSPSHRVYRAVPLDERSLGEDWSMGRYCTPPPRPPDFSPYPRPHWEDEPCFRPLPSQRVDREHKGSRSKGSQSGESDILDKSSRLGGKL